MKKKLILCLFILGVININGHSQYNKENAQLDQFIKEGKKAWQIPGLSVVVVKSGEIVFKKSYGIKDFQTGEQVDDNTMFSLGSTTKGFISFAIGILVDDGLINWDDKVRTHLPEFRLSDPYITEDIRVRDLLTHNMGFPQTDYLWSLDSLNSKDLIKKFSEIEPVYPVRGSFIYQNVMYVIAGEIIEAVSGHHWSDFIKKRILEPLEMTRTTTVAAEIETMGNIVTPHVITLDDKLITTEYTFSDYAGALGMMWSNVNDLSNYLKFIVNSGSYQQDTLIQLSTFNEIFTPQAIIPRGSPWNPRYQRLTNPSWLTYGFGWFQQDYRGKKIDMHTGSMAGVVASVAVMHDEDLAVYFVANLDKADFRFSMLYKVMDLYAFGDNSRNWSIDFLDIYQSNIQRRKRRLERVYSSRMKNTTPGFNLSEYEGIYESNLFGKLEINTLPDKLQMIMNDYHRFELNHWHLNTFHLDLDVFQDWIYFQSGPNGNISNLVFLGERFNKTDHE